MVIRIVVAALAGYVIGSVSPAYLLGRLLEGVDIRKVNFNNAGTRNVKKTLGLWPAVVTAIVDTTKGIVALLVAERLFGVTAGYAPIAGIAAIAGHIFPFYLGFRGGRGSATAIGIYIYYAALNIARGAFDPLSLAMIVGVAAIVYVATRSGEATGIIGFAYMAIMAPLELGITGVSLLQIGLSAFLLVSISLTARSRGAFRVESRLEMKPWRIIARPFALLFIPIDFLAGRRATLVLLGGVAAVFVVTDLIRLFTRVEMRALFRRREARRFSSMTAFLAASFFAFLLFPKEIAYLSVAFVTIGDLFSKQIGIRFGHTRIFAHRTLQGSLGFLAGALMVSHVLHVLLGFPLSYVFVGSLAATLVELFSERLDDNFTVGILGGAILMALRTFARV